MAKNKPPRPLTAKEKSVLEYLEQYVQHKGIAPSFQEVSDHFGFASLNSVQRYLRQLQEKNYIYIPSGNQKRAITLLHSSQALQSSLGSTSSGSRTPFQQPNSPIFSTQPSKETPPYYPPAESLSIPLFGRVAAGAPIEAHDFNEFIDVPQQLIRNPNKTFALRVQGQSMIESGICDGDFILVQKQEHAANGETIVAVIDNEATVKKYFVHKNRATESTAPPQVELRPANAAMESMWYRPEQVKVTGVVVGLIRKY